MNDLLTPLAVLGLILAVVSSAIARPLAELRGAGAAHYGSARYRYWSIGENLIYASPTIAPSAAIEN